MSKNLTQQDEQAVTCSMCRKPVPVVTNDKTPANNTSLYTYLTRCSHILCHICYTNVGCVTTGMKCKKCKKEIKQENVIRVYFPEVSGPLSKEVRDAHEKVGQMKKDLAEWRESDKKLRDRVDEIGTMVEEERRKLQDLINEVNAVLKSKPRAT
ncbi:unnamed protein product [Rhizoctonia solani]|uniref:RING-type domain-containing protein n=1 Tax=Rhizoctonia solani TaxID=456999 RepID=A0A8H3DH11_9AGAM|nr:unnamed protein product [Rhizoctonia solani]